MPTLIHNIGTLQTPLGSFPHAGLPRAKTGNIIMPPCFARAAL